MDDAQINAMFDAVFKELRASRGQSEVPSPKSEVAAPATPTTSDLKPRTADTGLRTSDLTIDLPDPTAMEQRSRPRVKNAQQPESLPALMASTMARIGVGRAGPHYNTYSLLVFQADHAVTQDALYKDVDQKLLDDLGLFTVQTKITGGKQEYLLRPDLGRQLDDEARRTVQEKCVKSPNLQLVVGDGLSAAAV